MSEMIGRVALGAAIAFAAIVLLAAIVEAVLS